jgi:hypothetical protein
MKLFLLLVVVVNILVCTSLKLRKHYFCIFVVNLQVLSFQLRLSRNVTRESQISTNVCPEPYRMPSASWVSRLKSTTCPILDTFCNQLEIPSRLHTVRTVFLLNLETYELTVLLNPTSSKRSEQYLLRINKTFKQSLFLSG